MSLETGRDFLIDGSDVSRVDRLSYGDSGLNGGEIGLGDRFN
jgi:hypothetical protein